MKEPTTKQGVRNLNHLPSPKRERLPRARYGPFRQWPWGDMECDDCGLFFEAHNV
jgi:hypothetical protein